MLSKEKSVMESQWIKWSFLVVKEHKTRSNYDNNNHLLANKFNFNTTNIAKCLLIDIGCQLREPLHLVPNQSHPRTSELCQSSRYRVSQLFNVLGKNANWIDVCVVSWKLPSTFLQ